MSNGEQAGLGKLPWSMTDLSVAHSKQVESPALWLAVDPSRPGVARAGWLNPQPSRINPQPVPAVQSHARGMAAGPINQQFQGGGTQGINQGGPPDPAVVAAAIASAKQAATTLIQYIDAHGCDGSPAFKGAVTALQASLNSVFQATGGLQGAQIPVDGNYGAQIQQGLTVLAPTLGLTFTPCNLSPAPPSPTPSTTPSGTAASMTTGEKVALGVGGAALLGLVAWAVWPKKGRRR
jgi:hypothetical protein